MPEGVIVGGWEYVIAAYVVTAVGLIAYTWSMVARWREARSARRGAHDER
jgi:hypothetical protein